MTYTLAALMERLGCKKYPQRWDCFFDRVVKDLEEKGNPFADPNFYVGLNQKYGVLQNHLEYYKNAAAQIAESEELSLFFALLCRAIEDREHFGKDLANLKMPEPKDGEEPLAYRLMGGLALCKATESFYADMVQRGLPEDVIMASLRLPEDSVEAYRRRHGGEVGFASFSWYQLYYDHRILRIGALTMEFPAPFPSIAHVIENDRGETVALATNVAIHRDGFPLGAKNFEDPDGSFRATLEETDEAFIGNAYDERGYVLREKQVFKKSEWRTVFGGGDGMISIHIPHGARFDAQTVDESINRTKRILKECYPEYDYKTFFCGSWLLDPQLCDILKPESNIVGFCKRFKPLAIADAGTCVFSFVFGKPNMDFEIADLPETTSLEMAIKNHYLGGKAIYEYFGYFLP